MTRHIWSFSQERGGITIEPCAGMIYPFGIHLQEGDMPKASTAKVFMTGRSQAVRLPKAFRFEGGEVRIRAEGSAVILEPIESNWDWLGKLHALGSLDQDAIEAASEDMPQQVRPELDLFQ